MPFLKSHLQKAIRRSNTYKAIKTACDLIRSNLGEFLRRILIIAVEDALPLDGFPVLVWFMAAVTKGYKLSSEQITWCLGYVYDLAKCPHYDPIVAGMPVLPLKNMRLHTLPENGKNLIYSMLFRESYGGLPGDKIMYRQSSTIWANRWHTNSTHLELLTRRVKYISPSDEGLLFNDWAVAAVDFHCSNVLQHVHEKFDDYTEEQIKQAIWYGSSSLTNKKPIIPTVGSPAQLEALALWKKIKKTVQAFGSYNIYKL